MNSLCSLWKRATFVKLKANASLMRGFAGSAVLFFKYCVLEKKSEEAEPLVKGTGAELASAPPPSPGLHLTAVGAFFRKNLIGATCVAVLRNMALSRQHQNPQSMQKRKIFRLSAGTCSPNRWLAGFFTLHSDVWGPH